MAYLNRGAALVASAVLMAAWGCGGGVEADRGAAAKSEATVTGTVTIKGRPAARGRINFEPLGANGMPAGSNVVQVGKGGVYTVTTRAGTNDVTASGTGDPAVDGTYNKTTFEARPGSNTLNLDLPIRP